MAMKERMKGGPRSTVTSLTVAAKLWPTATTMDAHSSGGNPDTTGSHGTTLTDLAVRLWSWPTPTAKLGDNNRVMALPALARDRHFRQGRRNLDDAVVIWDSSLPDLTTSGVGPKSSPSTRRLNPRFVAWLMGLPVGWTDTTTPLARTSFERWATESSRWLELLLCAYSPSGRG